MKYLYLIGGTVFFVMGSGVLVFGMPGYDEPADDIIQVEQQEEEQDTSSTNTNINTDAEPSAVVTAPAPTTQTIATTKCYGGDDDPDEDDWEGDDEDDKKNCVTEYTTVTVGSGTATSQAPVQATAPVATTPTTGSSVAPSTGSATAPASSGYTLANVSTHNTASNCWSAVDGKVYNLTNWISQHPGGAAEITAMCGVDASAAFSGQHAGARKPAQELAAFYLGDLAM